MMYAFSLRPLSIQPVICENNVRSFTTTDIFMTTYYTQRGELGTEVP
jgi:hypothetical protein